MSLPRRAASLNFDGHPAKLVQFWTAKRLYALMVLTCERSGETLSGFIRRAIWTLLVSEVTPSQLELFEREWKKKDTAPP